MKFNLSWLMYEIKCFLREKILYPVVLIPVIFMVIGINSINLSNDMVMHNIAMSSLTCALGSSKYGALSVVLAFSLFNILILSRDRTKRMEGIIGSICSGDKLNIICIMSVMFYGVISILLGMILTIAVQTVFYNVSFNILPYILCYGVITVPALIFAIFISTGIYLASESIDISILFMIILFFMGFLSSNYMLNWAQTSVDVFSDFAGIRPVFKLIIYNRILWFFISICILCAGFLCKRKFELSLIKSLKYNLKSKLSVFIFLLSITAMMLIYIKEPYCSKFIPHNDLLIDNNIVLTNVNPHIIFCTDNESLDAEVSYDFENNKSESLLFLKNEGLKIKSIIVNNKKSCYEPTDKSEVIKIKIPKDKNINIKINYYGKIKYYKGGAVAGYICKDSIYLLENSNWLLTPLSNNKKNIDIKGSYTAPADLCLIPCGKTTSVIDKGNNKIWNFEFKAQDMNIGVFAGKYKKEFFNVDGKNIEFYYSPAHEKYIKSDFLGTGSDIKEYIQHMFSYYSHTFGEYYTNDYPLKIVETSIYKSGGHSSGNVITFAEYMVNRNMGNTPVYMEGHTLIHDLNIIAHEMSHQWWGTGVNIHDDECFSSEGFAEYSSYKFVLNEFKNSIFEPYTDIILSSWKQRADNLDKSYYLKSAQNLEKLNKFYKENYKAEMSSIKRYDKMPLMLMNIEESKGEKKFLESLSKIYRDNKYGSLTYDEFIKQADISKEEFPNG